MQEPKFDQYKFRARERNSYLPIWERYFGSKKVSGKDLAYEEAIELNKKVDQLFSEGKVSSYQEASDLLNQEDKREYDEKYEIFWEELARAASLKFAELVNSGEFEKAHYTYMLLPGWRDNFKSPGRKEIEKDLGPDPLGGRRAGQLDWKSEILPYTIPTLYKYQREILNKKIKELEEKKDVEKIDKIKSIFKSILEEKTS